MKTAFNPAPSRQLLGNFILAITFILSLANRAHAGLSCEMNVVRYHQFGWYFYPNVTTNGVLDLPYGTYCFQSYGWPTNGSIALYQFDSTGFNQLSTPGDNGYGNYNDMMHELTNSMWFLYVTNSVTTNVYHFTVKANITSNDLPYVDIIYPPNGATGVPNNATFTWQGGPTDYSDLIAYQGPNSSFLPITQTSWQPPTMPDGPQNFNPHYDSNSTTAVISSQPVNNASQPISSWVSTDHLQDYSQSSFTVGAADGSGTAHTLVAYYPFDSLSAFVLDGGADASGNGYDMSFAATYGPEGGANLTSDSEAGIGAVQFNDGDGFSGGVLGWGQPTPPALLNALAGSFTISCWVKTTQSLDYSGDYAFNGAGIVTADVGGLANDTVPIALTGGAVAFNTGGNEDDTLTSQGTVNDGNYHHIVVTRNQQTGQKIIYIDGVMDDFGQGTTNLLIDPQKLTIGAMVDAGDPNPDDDGFYNGYDGELDDLQIYSGCLSSNEVASLFNNPGTTIANGGGSFGEALGAAGLTWSTSGDSGWFVEGTYTYTNQPSAAQSGPITDDESSTLSTTVTGPGVLTFYWACQGDPSGNFDYEFSIDGNDTDDLFPNTGWMQDGSFAIPAGQHTLSWTTFADGDENTTEAGYLDNVSYVVETPPAITLNPFDQTNYPGYQVWLDANASPTNASLSWQWYKVGVGAIPGATSSYYIPTNSGTASVAGSYYAVVSDDAGSVFTTTAMVAFVSAPLPPGWSTAFKSPFEPQDESQVTKDFYYGCFIDANSNIYTAAEFGGNMTVGAQNLESGPGGDAAAIVKQSATGSPLWAVGITNNGNASSYALNVAPAPGGGAYLAGNYTGNNWLGTNELLDNGNGNIFVAGFSASGSNLWVKTFGSTNGDFMLLNELVADPAGNVTISGLYGSGPVTVGSSNYVISGQAGILIQLDPTGAVRWSKLFSELPEYLAYGNGRLYTSFGASTSGGTTNITLDGVAYVTDRQWAIACLNETNGQVIWVRGVGAQYASGNGNPYAVGVIDDTPELAVSGTNVFVTGVAYSSNASFGNITVNFGDLRGQYIARYDTNGNAIVAATYGSVTTTPRTAVANAQGDLYVSGYFDNYSFFGQGMLAAPAGYDIENGAFSQSFLAKFDANGNALWADEAVSSSNVLFLGVALANNSVWVSGWGLSGNYPQPEYTAFGTNHVYSDAQFVFGGAGGGTAIIWYPAGMLAKVNDVPVALPVTLFDAANSSVDFQFQFLSESGFSHDVLYRTNLLVGNWQTFSTIAGDGTLKTVFIPLSFFGLSHQGFVKVTTR
jgi:Concanavalin A-like lectin/glucanases superfamily